MWKARNKVDLIIEVWEKLDCENVGAAEIEAIEIAVEAVYGKPAVDSPMVIARLLADEGAELRHSEIMELYVARASDRPYDAAFENLIDTTSLRSSRRSLKNLENLRKKFQRDADQEGIRLLRQKVIAEKERLIAATTKRKVTHQDRAEAGEIAEWLTLWLQSPELFDNWLELRRRTPDFVSRFGEI